MVKSNLKKVNGINNKIEGSNFCAKQKQILLNENKYYMQLMIWWEVGCIFPPGSARYLHVLSVFPFIWIETVLAQLIFGPNIG